jgi:hypothetical protein
MIDVYAAGTFSDKQLGVVKDLTEIIARADTQADIAAGARAARSHGG